MRSFFQRLVKRVRFRLASPSGGEHMSISAVAEELGLLRVRGYKPKFNYQSAIDRHLEAHPVVFSETDPPRLGGGGAMKRWRARPRTRSQRA